jgi:hypothetical protein
LGSRGVVVGGQQARTKPPRRTEDRNRRYRRHGDPRSFATIALGERGRASGSPFGLRRLARRLHALTSAAAAAQSLDESGNGSARSYRTARKRFGRQCADVAARQALNPHTLLGTQQTPHLAAAFEQRGVGKT